MDTLRRYHSVENVVLIVSWNMNFDGPKKLIGPNRRATVRTRWSWSLILRFLILVMDMISITKPSW